MIRLMAIFLISTTLLPSCVRRQESEISRQPVSSEEELILSDLKEVKGRLRALQEKADRYLWNDEFYEYRKVSNEIRDLNELQKELEERLKNLKENELVSYD